MAERTCLPIYQEAREKHAGTDPEKQRAFAAGFLHGQAEKVYLGACYAAMFRPSSQGAASLLELAGEAATLYGLEVVHLKNGEIWITTEGDVHQVWHIEDLVKDSPQYHHHRGWLCGVPHHAIDPLFHERDGYDGRDEACAVAKANDQ